MIIVDLLRAVAVVVDVVLLKAVVLLEPDHGHGSPESGVHGTVGGSTHWEEAVQACSPVVQLRERQAEHAELLRK